MPSIAPAPFGLFSMVSLRMVQLVAESWLTTPSDCGATKFSIVRYSTVTPVAFDDERVVVGVLAVDHRAGGADERVAVGRLELAELAGADGVGARGEPVRRVRRADAAFEFVPAGRVTAPAVASTVR